MLLLIFFYIYIFVFIFKCFLYIVCYFHFTHFLIIFMMALNDLTGPSAGPLARIPYFIHSNRGAILQARMDRRTETSQKDVLIPKDPKKFSKQTNLLRN